MIIDGSRQWESYIYMNRSANLREEEIYKLVKPFFEREYFTFVCVFIKLSKHYTKKLET